MPSKKIAAVRCNLCGSARYSLVYRTKRSKKAESLKLKYQISESALDKPEKIVQCMSCDLIYTFPTEKKEAIHTAYTEMEDDEYIREELGRRAQARMILKTIAKYKNRGALLDIGCGPGFLLDEAQKQGWNVNGVELSHWGKKYCENTFKIPVRQGTLHSASFLSKSFDVIVMSDVIEHVVNPKELLQEIRRILKDDGVLYLTTPDIASFLSRLLRAKWWGINRFHLFYFTRKTLERMFDAAGLKSVSYSAYPRIFSLSYWAKRLESYPGFIQLPFKLLARLGCNKMIKIVLHDQIGVIAKKIRRLDTLDDRLDSLPGEGSVTPSKKQKVCVVLPAYNAARTLERTVADIPTDCVDEILLVDDASQDDTVKIAKRLGLTVFTHSKNSGYGANQKTCYQKATERGADIVVMVHPDYQYDPRIIPQMLAPILEGKADAVFGSRMMKGGALEGGMPRWKYNANILLTAFENVVLGTYLTEYHSGFRAYRTDVLSNIRYLENSDNFVFDTEIIVQLIVNRYRIEEIPIHTRYFEEASSIKLLPSILYGLSILGTLLLYTLHKSGILKYSKLVPVPRNSL